jgi:hypothetical protein
MYLLSLQSLNSDATSAEFWLQIQEAGVFFVETDYFGVLEFLGGNGASWYSCDLPFQDV